MRPATVCRFLRMSSGICLHGRTMPSAGIPMLLPPSEMKQKFAGNRARKHPAKNPHALMIRLPRLRNQEISTASASRHTDPILIPGTWYRPKLKR